MINAEPREDEYDEVELLLPWYATGRLSDEERRRVERYLEANPQARFQLELIEEELGAVVADNERLPVPSRESFDRLMAQVETEAPAGADRATFGEGWLTRIGAWFGDFTPQMRGAMAAAAFAVVLVQATAIGLLLREDGAVFETVAEHPAPAVDGETVLVAFAPDTPAQAITELLTEIGGAIVDGPRAGGVFVIRLAEGVVAAEAVVALQERPNMVTFAAPGD